MNHSEFLATRLSEVYLDGKWIANTNFKEQIEHLPWQQATRQLMNANSIALLTYHVNYYLAGLLKVLDGGNLEISDKYSFDMPPIESEAGWHNLLHSFLENAALFAGKVSQLPEEMLDKPFVNEKYGSYRRNLEGVIEHSYYHLGQVVLLNKLLLDKP